MKKMPAFPGACVEHVFNVPSTLKTCPTVCILVLANCVAVTAEDLVVLQAKDGRGTMQTGGEIVDFTGTQLTLRRAGGREESIPTERVVEIRSDWNAAHRSADEHFAKRQFAEAATEYRKALADEQRTWAKRRILARLVWSLRNCGQTELAIDSFLQLFRNDPTTQFFDAIPLTWLAVQPAAGLERKVRELLGPRESPAARLIGASWLLATVDRAATLEALQTLRGEDDSRIALLAEAQLWRTQVVTVKADEVARWRERVLRMPPSLQAGPSFVVGQALSRQKQPEAAALLFLRVPILHPLERALAAQSLLAAGRELETMPATEAMPNAVSAATLYREILSDHADSPAATEAKQRLQALTDPGREKK